jgi:N6-adenosine-specific RNA methylase IME4
MRTTEFALFCRRGSLDLMKLGKRLDFEAKRREHSRKPDEFYDLIAEVSPAPRIDIFSREDRDGFDSWGNEVGRFG